MTPLEDAADTLLLVGILAKRGAETPGCDNWRAVEMCRQIVDVVKRNTPNNETPIHPTA